MVDFFKALEKQDAKMLVGTMEPDFVDQLKDVLGKDYIDLLEEYFFLEFPDDLKFTIRELRTEIEGERRAKVTVVEGTMSYTDEDGEKVSEEADEADMEPFEVVKVDGDWYISEETLVEWGFDLSDLEDIDMEDLDIVATPHDYRCRWIGFGYDPEGVGDSIQLHGRIMFVEEDQRSFANNERGLFGSIEPGEEEAVLYRNLAASLTKGHQTYPMDVCVGYFEDEKIQEIIERRAEIERRYLDLPRHDVPSCVMLVDDRSGIHTDFSAEYNDLAVIRQRIWGMNHCGVPTRTFLWDDLARTDFPQCHKLFILPNCYRCDAQVMAMLRILRATLLRCACWRTRMTAGTIAGTRASGASSMAAASRPSTRTPVASWRTVSAAGGNCWPATARNRCTATR